jgi:hypothetical protein
MRVGPHALGIGDGARRDVTQLVVVAAPPPDGAAAWTADLARRWIP